MLDGCADMEVDPIFGEVDSARDLVLDQFKEEFLAEVFQLGLGDGCDGVEGQGLVFLAGRWRAGRDVSDQGSF